MANTAQNRPRKSSAGGNKGDDEPNKPGTLAWTRNGESGGRRPPELARKMFWNKGETRINKVSIE